MAKNPNMRSSKVGSVKPTEGREQVVIYLPNGEPIGLRYADAKELQAKK